MKNYNKSDVLRWAASPNRQNEVQHTSDIDGRIRRVLFPLGGAACSSFLQAMELQLKLQAVNRPAARPAKKPATKCVSMYDSALWQSRIKNCTEDGALHLTRCASRYNTSKGGLWAYAKKRRIRTASQSEVNAAERVGRPSN